MFKRVFEDYILNNKYDIILISILVIVGVISGIIGYLLLGDEIKSLAISNAKEVFDISKQDTYIKTNIILNGIKANIVLILVMLICSVTLFGKWPIYFILILKGVAVGLYIGVLYSIFGLWWGIVVNILLVILVNMIYFPALIFLATSLISFNFDIFKMRKDYLSIGNIWKVISSVLVSFLVIFSSIIVEQIISGVVLNIYTKL